MAGRTWNAASLLPPLRCRPSASWLRWRTASRRPTRIRCWRWCSRRSWSRIVVPFDAAMEALSAQALAMVYPDRDTVGPRRPILPRPVF